MSRSHAGAEAVEDTVAVVVVMAEVAATGEAEEATAVVDTSAVVAGADTSVVAAHTSAGALDTSVAAEPGPAALAMVAVRWKCRAAPSAQAV